MMRVCIAALLALVVSLPPTRSAAAQVPAATGALTGRVLSSVPEAPTPRATLRVVGHALPAPTDATGPLTLRGVPVGMAPLHIPAPGSSPV